MAKNDPTQSNNWPDDPDEPTAPTLPVIETPAPPTSDNESQADEGKADATRISIPDRPTEKQASLARAPLGKTQLVPVEPGKNENHNALATPLPVDVAREEGGNHNAPTTPIPSNGVADEHTVYRRPANARPVIAVRNLTKTYILGKKTRVQALRGVSLEVYPGEFVTIMGPSGSGKSTFMNLLGCLDRPTSGEYWLAGELVSKLSNDQLAGMRNQLLGFVFQGFNLLGRATAVRNVALPMVYAGVPRRERERRARKVLHLVGLGGRLDHKPNELSGGQQQRVAIARALVNGPSLLLADEPTGNLDSKTSIEIMGVLQALNEQGLTIVLVTHDSKVAEYAKRQVAFLDGQIVRDEPVLAPRSAQKEWEALVSQSAGAAVGEEEPS
jgi:putative ABC transport system ATP-binding protein